MSIEFKRDELYAEVWQTPLTQLGKKYGLSDKGLRKVCKAMNIPLPVAGHWARIAAGQKIARRPLPQKAERITFVSEPIPKQERHELPEDAAWLAEHTALVTQPGNQIAVESVPAHWHAAVRKLREILRGEAKALIAMLATSSARKFRGFPVIR